MSRRTDNLYSNFNARKEAPRRSSSFVRMMVEWIAVALILGGGTVFILSYFG
ncbi:MAG: hypothetical protein ACK4F5_16910 [Aliihoeflea sp.]